MRNGIRRIHTTGYTTTANNATGQQSTRTMHQTRNVPTLANTTDRGNWFGTVAGCSTHSDWLIRHETSELHRTARGIWRRGDFPIPGLSEIRQPIFEQPLETVEPVLRGLPTMEYAYEEPGCLDYSVRVACATV
jgi:hypothetical protein